MPVSGIPQLSCQAIANAFASWEAQAVICCGGFVSVAAVHVH